MLSEADVRLEIDEALKNKGWNLSGKNLQGANLQGANLQGANLEGANLEGAKLPSAEKMKRFGIPLSVMKPYYDKRECYHAGYNGVTRERDRHLLGVYIYSWR